MMRLFGASKKIVVEERSDSEPSVHAGEGISHKLPKGVPHVVRGTHGTARASETNLCMQSVWDLYDRDRDGWLTEDQLLMALEAVGIQVCEGRPLCVCVCVQVNEGWQACMRMLPIILVATTSALV